MAKKLEPDYKRIPDELIDEVRQNGERCLQGTIELALAADQRATTLAGVFGAGSVAMLVAGTTIRAALPDDAAMIWAAIVIGSGLYASALICAWSARPVDFYVGGYEPDKWLEFTGTHAQMQQAVSKDLQRRINNNRDISARAARMLNFGTVIAALAPLLGVLGYIFI